MSGQAVPKPDRGAPTLLGWIDALANSPSLPGAACEGRAPLFDYWLDEDPDGNNEPWAHRKERHRRALELCESCPALTACREWAADYPTDKLSGVVAGELRRTTRKRTTR